MDIIKFNTRLKADGKEYSRIVYWNRFWRNKTELILSLSLIHISEPTRPY